MPKISIIVPIYNVEKYLQRCMDSLFNQTLKDIEIILVDDESPDNCPAMCDAFAIQDSRVKVIHKKNQGLGLARNSGMEVAAGDYIMFVDSDDFITQDAADVLYQAAIENNVDVVFSNFYLEKRDKTFEPVLEILAFGKVEGKEAVKIFLTEMMGMPPEFPFDRKYSMSVWHGIYSNKVIRKHNLRFVSERMFPSEDIVFHIDFLGHSRKILKLPNPTYHYCLNEASLSNTFTEEKLKKFEMLHAEILRRLIGVDMVEGTRNAADRLFLSYMRSALITRFHGSNQPNRSLKLIRMICNDVYFQSVIKRYPYSKMPLKHKLFMVLMDKKRIYTLFILTSFINVIRAVKNR